MNNITIIGNMVREPEIKECKDFTLARFSVAVHRNEEETDFFECSAFNASAEIAEKYLHKGDKVGISGDMRIDKYQDEQSGDWKTWAYINVRRIELCGSRKEDDDNSSKKKTSYKRK